MLENLLAVQLYSAPVWPSAASQRMTSNRGGGLQSAAGVTSPGRLAVDDRGWRAINKSVSAVSTELQNSVERTFLRLTPKWTERFLCWMQSII